jgi:hypothetical protein
MRSKRARAAQEVHEAATLSDLCILHRKRARVAQFHEHCGVYGNKVLHSRIQSMCSKRSWPVSSNGLASGTLVVTSNLCEASTIGDTEHLRKQMMALFDMEFAALRRVDTEEGSTVNLLRNMVEGRSSPLYPAWATTLQVALVDGSALVGAALILVLGPSLAWMPLLMVHPGKQRLGYGGLLAKTVCSLVAGLLIGSLIIPSHLDAKLIAWWQRQTCAVVMKSQEAEALFDCFPSVRDLKRTKLLCAHLFEQHDGVSVTRHGPQVSTIADVLNARVAVRKALALKCLENGVDPIQCVSDVDVATSKESVGLPGDFLMPWEEECLKISIDKDVKNVLLGSEPPAKNMRTNAE